MKHKRTSLLIFFAASAFLMVREATAQDSIAPRPLTELEQMMADYRFSEATEKLNDDIKKAKRRRKSTEELEAQLEEAEKGERFLGETQRIVFVDSVVVPKDQLLSAYFLSHDAGTLHDAQNFVTEHGIPIAAYSRRSSAGSILLGEALFCNELSDMAYFATSATSKLALACRYGESWSQPEALRPLADMEGMQDYPFVLGDGITLYFASTNHEGLGGFDIYKSRYNSATGQWVEPENLGMPFNSPANDYLYAEDEALGVGYFATDRRQPTGYVCVYTFLLPERREAVSGEEETLRNVALINSIAETQLGKTREVAQAQANIATLRRERGTTSTPGTTTLRIVLDDNTVYTSLSQFKNSLARTAAEQWIAKQEELEELEASLAITRASYATTGRGNAAIAAQILNLETQELTLRDQIRSLSNQMRKYEGVQ